MDKFELFYYVLFKNVGYVNLQKLFSLPNQILHINSLLQAKLIIYNNLEKNSQNITIVVNAIYNARGPTSVLSQNFAYRETYEQFCNAIQSLLNY